MGLALLCLIGYLLGALSSPVRVVGSPRRPALRAATALEIATGVALWAFIVFVIPAPGWRVLPPAFVFALGARFPAFSRFRGRPGIAGVSAFLLCLLVETAVSSSQTVSSAVILIVVTGILVFSTRVWQVPALAVGIYVAVIYPLRLGLDGYTIAVSGLALYIVIESFISIKRSKLFDFQGSGEIKLWRIVARPFALLFALIDVTSGRRPLLFVIGIVALVFIATDFFRLVTKADISALFKKKEANRFSSMTLFLVSVFLTFLLFPSSIPYVSLVCITFGDFFSKMIGIRFGTKKLYKSRTLQGTLGFLAGGLMFNEIARSLFSIPLIYIIIGSIVASVVELFSEAIDDNFSVSIVTGGVLTALRFFLTI